MTDSQVPLSRLANVKATRDRTESVCLRAHGLGAVKKVCYRYAPRHFSALEVADDGATASVVFRFPTTVSADQEQHIIESFRHDLLDQDLRETISEKTETIRNLIFANAFANTSLVTDED